MIYATIATAITILVMKYIWYPIRSAKDFAKLKWENKQSKSLIEALKFNLKQLREVMDADCKKNNSKQDSFSVSK